MQWLVFDSLLRDIAQNYIRDRHDLNTEMFMDNNFDVDDFNNRFGRILALPHTTTLDRRLMEIEHLRRDFANLNNEAAQTYVNSAVGRLILEAMIDTSQTLDVVSEQFRNNVGHGFDCA